jgi:hypothetical protein
MGEESGTECRGNHRSGICNHGDDRESALCHFPDEEVPYHRHGKRHAGTGSRALDKARKQQEVQRPGESTGEASKRKKQQAKQQHGAPAISVGEWPVCDGAERKSSHEEAERELCHSRSDVQGMSDRAQSRESHVDRDRRQCGEGSEKECEKTSVCFELHKTSPGRPFGLLPHELNTCGRVLVVIKKMPGTTHGPSHLSGCT